MDGFKHRGEAGRSLWLRCLLFVWLSWQLGVGVLAQKRATPALTRSFATTPKVSVSTSEQEAQNLCVGVFLAYKGNGNPVEIHPYNATDQPYSFVGLITLTNLGYEELPLWELSINFQHKEVIAEAGDVLFLNGQSPPGLQTTNDTRLVGVTTPNLLTSIDTAANLHLISTTFNITGTEFGVNETEHPLPANMTLVNPGYNCNINNSADVGQLWVCCTENQTAIDSVTYEGDFLPRQKGDIIMSYDVVSASQTYYTAQVSIVMNDPIGRLDFWNLTWHWTAGEFINTMKGATVLGGSDQDLCVYGDAAVQYPDQPFKDVLSCSPDPVFIDLEPRMATDATVGLQHCCRNGSLLPDLIDPAQSRSDFQVEVWKLAPHNILDDITPPMNWNIGEGYTCLQPFRVSPAELTPDALHSSSAVASWQVICNVTQNDTSPKTCCVSFSAFYNDSVIPCPACSCGCSQPPTSPWNGDTCNSNLSPSLLPYQAVLLPPSNRTSLAKELARLDHYAYPQPGYPLPCPDNCGISINWHVYSDYTNGWSSRITIFNWETQQVVDWSVAVQMQNAMPGYQNVYSFNGTLVPDVNEFNNTLFIQGREDFNTYLLGKDSMDTPGKLQSIISFDKRKTPGLVVPALNGGFPDKVWFNGDECLLPVTVPGGDGWRLVPTFQFAIVIAVAIFLMAGDTIRFL